MSHTVDVLPLAADVELIHVPERVLHGWASHEFGVPGCKMWVLALDVEVLWEEMVDSVVIVLDKSEVRDRALVPDQPTSNRIISKQVE